MSTTQEMIDNIPAQKSCVAGNSDLHDTLPALNVQALAVIEHLITWSLAVSAGMTLRLLVAIDHGLNIVKIAGSTSATIEDAVPHRYTIRIIPRRHTPKSPNTVRSSSS